MLTNGKGRFCYGWYRMVLPSKTLWLILVSVCEVVLSGCGNSELESQLYIEKRGVVYCPYCSHNEEPNVLITTTDTKKEYHDITDVSSRSKGMDHVWIAKIKALCPKVGTITHSAEYSYRKGVVCCVKNLGITGEKPEHKYAPLYVPLINGQRVTRTELTRAGKDGYRLLYIFDQMSFGAPPGFLDVVFDGYPLFDFPFIGKFIGIGNAAIKERRIKSYLAEKPNISLQESISLTIIDKERSWYETGGFWATFAKVIVFVMESIVCIIICTVICSLLLCGMILGTDWLKSRRKS